MADVFFNQDHLSPGGNHWTDRVVEIRPSKKAADRDSVITLPHSNSILSVVVYAWLPNTQELRQEYY